MMIRIGKRNRNRSHWRTRRRSLRVECLGQRRLMAADFTNPSNPLDVNDDSAVTPLDALNVVNYLASNGAGEPEFIASESPPDFYLDADANGFITPLDALTVINALSSGQEEPSSGQAEEDTDLSSDSDIATTTDFGPIGDLILDLEIPPPAIFEFDLDPGVSPEIDFSGNGIFAVITSDAPGFLTLTASSLQEVVDSLDDGVSAASAVIDDGVIDGFPDPLFTESFTIEQDLIIDATGFANVLLFDEAIIPDDLIIDLDGDFNGVGVIFSSIGDDLVFRGDGGSEGLLIAGSSISDDTNVRLEGAPDLGVIFDSFFGDDLIFNTGSGSDVLIVDGALVGDDAIVRLGSGDDFASIEEVEVNDVADIEGDGGFDTLAADVDSVLADRIEAEEFEDFDEPIDVDEILDLLIDELFLPSPVLV